MNDKIINKLLEDYKDATDIFKRNIIKEYLQIICLSYIYSHNIYSNLIFYGGSCLKHCYGLDRLSEDLDFVDLQKDVDLNKLANDITRFLSNELDVKVTAKVQKFRVYLKFPILGELGFATAGGSDFLFLKIEIFKEFDFCKVSKIEIRPIFKFSKSILIKTFDLPTLMATKIRAILYRKWEKKDKSGNILVKVKGRDYFDLMWYLNKGILPNLKCIENVNDLNGLKLKLLEIIKKIDAKSIKLDLESLIDDLNFVENLSLNLKDILIRELDQKFI